jgi:sulfate permease, SulP family
MKRKKNTRRVLPFLDWFPIDGKTLKSDFVVGVTVALLLIPQSMAYAELAGMPAHYGLYASFVPVILAAAFGHLPQIASGPTALTAIVTASVLMPLVTGLSGEDYMEKYIQLAILLSLVVGLVRIALSILKMATIVNFISHPVIIGFTNAGALVICLSQMGRLIGVEGPPENNLGFGGFLSDILQTLGNINNINLETLAFGLGSLILLFLFKRFAPKLPGALFVVFVSILLSFFLGYHENYPEATIGLVPSGLPDFGLMEWNFVGSESEGMWLTAFKMIPAAFVVTIIGFMEVLVISKAISIKTRQGMDLNQELKAQGIAAVGGFFCQAYPTSASVSRSAMNMEYGGKTGMANIFAGLGVLSVLFFFTDYLAVLPKATLSALIVMSVLSLVNFSPISLAWKATKSDGVAAAATMLFTLLFAPQIIYGIIIGALVALGMYMYRSMKPDVQIFGIDKTDLNEAEALVAQSEHIIALRFRGSLFFASMAFFESRIHDAIASQPDASHIIVVADGINRIDASGEWGLRQLLDVLKENSFTLAFAGLPESSKATLERTGLVDKIGEENFHVTLEKAINTIHDEISPVEHYMI